MPVVHILTQVNSQNITKQTINNVDHIVVKNVVPIVDDIVMNRGLYPATEIDKSYKTLNGRIMPYNHPQVNNKWVSASDAQALNEHYVGAWCDNARKENGRVLVDMFINTDVASRSERGKEVLDRINKLANHEDTTPIHVSTGLLLNRVNAKGSSKGKNYDWIATEMQFDHLAILLHDQGAGTPSEGVGIFANQSVEKAVLETCADYTQEETGVLARLKRFYKNNAKLDFSVLHTQITGQLPSGTWLERVYNEYVVYEKDDKLYKQNYMIDNKGIVTLQDEPVEVTIEYKHTHNKEDHSMKNKVIAKLNEAGVNTANMSDEQLLAEYSKLNTQQNNTAEQPLTLEQVQAVVTTAVSAAMNAQAEKAKETEKAAKREAVKNHFALTDAAVNSLGDDALHEMYVKTQPAHGLNQQQKSPQQLEFNYSINDLIDKVAKKGEE